MPNLLVAGILLVILQVAVGFLPHATALAVRLIMFGIAVAAGIVWMSHQWAHQMDLMSTILKPG